MKHFLLKAIVDRFEEFKSIRYITRVGNNLLKIEFNSENIYYFDMTKGDSKIYIRDEYIPNRLYQAPFDTILKKRFSKSNLDRVYLLNGDKIIRFETSISQSYKSIKTILQFEFTGRNTNVIILDESETILEALRHIDISTSFREIKPNRELLPLPKSNFNFEIKEIDNIDELLRDNYKKLLDIKLNQLKNYKTSIIQKRVEKFEKLLNSLESEENLLKESEKLSLNANIILANLHKIESYQHSVELEDFESNIVKIDMPKESKSPTQSANILFNRAKKLKQKAKNIHIERESLSSKISFLKRLKSLILESNSLDEIEFYYPKQKRVKIDKKFKEFESFTIENYKIYVGKSQKENIELLKVAKSTDIWMHLKDRNSAHIIIQTSKKRPPQRVIELGAKLCVDFSTKEHQKGSYLVDYTTRKDVRVQKGSNVLYYNYKSISILK